MHNYLDDFVSNITCEEYYEEEREYEYECVDTPYGYSYGIPDAPVNYSAATSEYDWND